MQCTTAGVTNAKATKTNQTQCIRSSHTYPSMPGAKLRYHPIMPGALRALCPVTRGVTPGIRPYARCHSLIMRCRRTQMVLESLIVLHYRFLRSTFISPARRNQLGQMEQEFILNVLEEVTVHQVHSLKSNMFSFILSLSQCSEFSCFSVFCVHVNVMYVDWALENLNSFLRYLSQ